MLLDTVEEVFSGDKELFKGLWIYDSDFEFDRLPVIRLDLSGIANETADELKYSLNDRLIKKSQIENIKLSGAIPSDTLNHLIEDLYAKHGKKIVVLIDEYDKPVLDHIGDAEKAEKNRTLLRSVYGVLKSMDSIIQFTFITGVTKFTKTSIFSELNNLLDITLMEDYANICGITMEEYGIYFDEYVQWISNLKKFNQCKNIQDDILAWYNGYSWDGETRLINPFSLFSFFRQKRFSSFWYASGTPGFMLKLLKQQPESFLELKNYELSERMLDSFDIRRIEIEPLLFQTGYLTVDQKIFRGVVENYLLKIPNREVEEALYLNIIAEFTEKGNAFAEKSYRQIYDSLKSGDLNIMLDVLKTLFASIPYELHINREAYYHSIFYAVMRTLGLNTESEVSVSGGRVDAVLKIGNIVYVMEFKYHDCDSGADSEVKEKLINNLLDEGMRQIKEKGYTDKFANRNSTVYRVAFAFLGKDDITMMVETV